MTDAKNEWVARVPSECLYCEDCGTETLASAYAAERLAMECNEQLTAARARISELEKVRDSVLTVLDEYSCRLSPEVGEECYCLPCRIMAAVKGAHR